MLYFGALFETVTKKLFIRLIIRMRRRSKFLLFRVYKYRDTGAYGELYDFYISRIRRFIVFRVKHIEDAEEIAAEVFLRGWEYATSSVVNNPGALFYKIARNLIADHYRKKKKETSLEEAAEVPDSVEFAEELAINEEHTALVEQLKTLKEEYRDVLMMRFLEEMSIAEISEALEKTAGSVRVTLHRAKNALKNKTK